MTPFMHTVQDVLDGRVAPEPATEGSHPAPVPVATDVQVAIRSLAEPSVCEANAVLRHTGDVITLDDECGPGALAFTLGYRDRSVLVRTAVSGTDAEARLFVGGEPNSGTCRLAALSPGCVKACSTVRQLGLPSVVGKSPSEESRS